MPPTHWRIAGTVVAGVTVMLLADAAEPVNESIKLNVRPGLWEVSAEGQISGAPPISDDMLARLTPEQRARLEAAMQSSMANASKPQRSRHCVTPEKVAQGLAVDESAHADSDCHKKILSNSSNEFDISEQCVRDNESTVLSEHFQFSGPQQMTGNVHVVRTAGGKTMTVDKTIHGKWLAASCGDVKDFEIEK
ncbi:MAG TPA: DUF3617 family protein [Steroidobacteraceae bacterium]